MANLSEEEQRRVSNHLRIANGYLELGMMREAWSELELIEPRHRSLTDVIQVRVDVCHALEKWELMAELSGALAKEEPNESGHLLNLAYATRRLFCVEKAEEILREAETKFPDDALIKYNLGCFRAVSGRATEARLVLAEAFQKDPALRITALDDPDLEGIW